MKLSQIDDFISVADAGSIRAAARLRGLSQPAVTKNVRALERELGTALLRRSAHGVELTEPGRLFLTRARIINREIERSRHELAHSGMTDNVTIGSAPGVAAVLLPTALARLRREYPNVEVRIIDAMPHVSLPRVRDGSVDFAMGPLLQTPAAADLIATPLINVEIAIVTRRGHPLAKVRTLTELMDQDWVTGGVPSHSNVIVDEMFRSAGLLPPRWVVRCESIAGLIAIIAKTDFIATIPKPLVTLGMAGGLLEIVRVREKLGVSTVCLFTKRESPLTPAAARLSKFIKDAAKRAT